MWQWTDGTSELYHYGVKGMKWGVRKASRYGGISGMIRRKQIANATNKRSEIMTRQRQNASELGELQRYAKNPSKIGKSRLSTTIRNHQIKSLKKKQAKLGQSRKDIDSALSELNAIDKYQREKRASRGKKRLESRLAKKKR